MIRTCILETTNNCSLFEYNYATVGIVPLCAFWNQNSKRIFRGDERKSPGKNANTRPLGHMHVLFSSERKKSEFDQRDRAENDMSRTRFHLKIQVYMHIHTYIYIYTYIWVWHGPFGIMRPSPLFSSTRALTSLSLSLSCCSSLWVLLCTHIVFVSHLFPVFPSASSLLSLLLLFSLGAFGTEDSPCLPCVPPCVLIEPISPTCCFCLGFRTFRCCFGTMNFQSLSCVCLFLHRLVVVLLSPVLFVPPCYCSSSWVLQGIGTSLSPMPSLLSPLLCVLRSGGFGNVSFHACPPCSLQLVPSLLSPSHSLSLSLAVRVSGRVSGHMIVFVSHPVPHLSSLFSPSCSFNSFSIAVLLSGCFAKNGFPGLLYFSLSVFLCSGLLVCLEIAVLVSACFGTKPFVR